MKGATDGSSEPDSRRFRIPVSGIGGVRGVPSAVLILPTLSDSWMPVCITVWNRTHPHRSLLPGNRDLSIAMQMLTLRAYQCAMPVATPIQ